MTYDEGLAERVREAMEHLRGVSEKKMFGGLAFMIGGHMSVGVVRDTLMVRAGPEACDFLKSKPHARAMDFTGRPMKGFLFVEASGLEDDHELAHWIGHAVEYALTLPPKSIEARAPAAGRPKGVAGENVRTPTRSGRKKAPRPRQKR